MMEYIDTVLEEAALRESLVIHAGVCDRCLLWLGSDQTDYRPECADGWAMINDLVKVALLQEKYITPNHRA